MASTSSQKDLTHWMVPMETHFENEFALLNQHETNQFLMFFVAFFHDGNKMAPGSFWSHFQRGTQCGTKKATSHLHPHNFGLVRYRVINCISQWWSHDVDCWNSPKFLSMLTAKFDCFQGYGFFECIRICHWSVNCIISLYSSKSTNFSRR